MNWRRVFLFALGFCLLDVFGGLPFVVIGAILPDGTGDFPLWARVGSLFTGSLAILLLSMRLAVLQRRRLVAHAGTAGLIAWFASWPLSALMQTDVSIGYWLIEGFDITVPIAVGVALGVLFLSPATGRGEAVGDRGEASRLAGARRLGVAGGCVLLVVIWVRVIVSRVAELASQVMIP
jgi:hypothetical protein